MKLKGDSSLFGRGARALSTAPEGSGVLPYSRPLAPGGTFRDADDNDSCNLLVQLESKPA
jgi:hypothetical protein